MRITSVVLVFSMLFSWPSLAGKKKREKLEACKASIEFVPPMAKPVSTWGSKIPKGGRYGDDWTACCNAGTIWGGDFRNDTKWQKGAKGVVDGREYVVIRKYQWHAPCINFDLYAAFYYAGERARVYACRWGGDAILQAESYCSGSCDPSPHGLFGGDSWSLGLAGIVVKWVEPTEE